MIPDSMNIKPCFDDCDLQESEFEAKVGKLVELGFERDAVVQALKLFNGNEDQAAGFLFGGF